MKWTQWLRLPGAVLLAALVFIPAGALSQAIGRTIPEGWAWGEWLSTSIFQLLMAAVAMLIMLIIGRGRLGRFGFRLGSDLPVRAVVIAVFAMEALVTLAFLPFPEKGPGHFAGDFSFLQTVLGVWLIASTCEEIVTRGLVQGFLEPLSGRGVRIARLHLSVPVIAAAVLFSAMHVPLLVMGIDTALGVQILVATFGLGLIAGYYRERTGSLLPAILAHMLANAFGMGFGELVSLLR